MGSHTHEGVRNGQRDLNKNQATATVFRLQRPEDTVWQVAMAWHPRFARGVRPWRRSRPRQLAFTL